MAPRWRKGTKERRRGRWFGAFLLVLLLVACLAGAAWLFLIPDAPPAESPTGDDPDEAVAAAPQYVPSNDPPAAPLATLPLDETCEAVAPPGAAEANAESLNTRTWAPFGRQEVGWTIYAPRIGAELATACGPGTTRFAAALAGWQAAHRLTPTGILDDATFDAMRVRWTLARPFAAINARGECPNAPAPSGLNTARPDEVYGGKPAQLRPGALDAYRRMVEAARKDGVVSSRDPRVLTIFSSFRDPAADAARCARDNNCQGVTRTICSAHRTGLAVDLFIAAAPGYGPDSSADDNRRFMARSDVYRWLVVNAGRFGFVNYVFEPWHWEWTGEPPLPGVPISSLPHEGSQPLDQKPPTPQPSPKGLLTKKNEVR
ncbi:D-alanyl-D-alanine carboxypeptidase family protein [Caulobacter hibisci]|uniref:D-alanyl-D-alanine carboxypeptidase family protein n=1 Tax=Caulobacter hibisci TaxID=2035993 RepID=UPI001E36C505|nr:D-alanyl-D-alanine carboxypeptidase family protein [Caulobacter hibisci]